MVNSTAWSGRWCLAHGNVVCLLSSPFSVQCTRALVKSQLIVLFHSWTEHDFYKLKAMYCCQLVIKRFLVQIFWMYNCTVMCCTCVHQKHFYGSVTKNGMYMAWACHWRRRAFEPMFFRGSALFFDANNCANRNELLVRSSLKLETLSHKLELPMADLLVCFSLLASDAA